MNAAKKEVPSGASVKPGNVIAILFPEKMPADHNVRFVVWVPKDVFLKAKAEGIGVLSKTLEAFPEPKFTPHGPIRGVDGSYYCLVDLMDTKDYNEIRKATATLRSILRQVFGIQPSLSHYTSQAGLRAFEKEVGLGITPFPVKKESDSPQVRQ